MNIGQLIFSLVLGAGLLVGIGVFGTIAVRSFRNRGFARFCGVMGGVLMCYGMVAFVVTIFEPAKYLPSGVEWPMGWGGDVATTPSGMHIAVHSASQRVQVYDADWRFVRGWYVETGRGGFYRVGALADDIVQVSMHSGSILFDLQGNRLDRPETPALAASPPASGLRLGPYIPTWYVLLPLAHPFLGWLMCVVGALALVACGRLPIGERAKHASSWR